jgi:Rod binding domain-containing protein
MFINAMLQQVFAGVGEGPFSGGYAGGVWRSFLTDEYAKVIVRAGGFGIADHVQRFLLAQQEAVATRQAPTVSAP